MASRRIVVVTFHFLFHVFHGVPFRIDPAFGRRGRAELPRGAYAASSFVKKDLDRGRPRDGLTLSTGMILVAPAGIVEGADCATR